VFTDKLRVVEQKTAGKGSVLRRCLNVFSDGADVTVHGGLFHARAAATAKACRWRWRDRERERERERETGRRKDDGVGGCRA